MFFCCDCSQPKDNPASLKIKKVDNYIYKPNDKIGEGRFSSVYMGIDEETGNTIAIKVVKVNVIKSQTLYDLLQNQIELMRDLKHPNILQCFCAMNSKNNCYIVTQYCANGDLQRYLKVNGALDEQAVSRIAYDIYKGLQYLAEKQIVHRDLKVANVFLNQSGVAKIGDFGFAVKTPGNIKDISVGSPVYMSPQALLRCEYGPKTDVWAFGIVLYELLHQETPLGHLTSQEELKRQIMNPPKFKANISKQLKSFILLCLDPNERTRISLKQIKQTPFMKKLIDSVEGGKLRKSTLNVQQGVDRAKLVVSNTFLRIKTEQAIAMVHYCRLIHKVTKQQKIPSMVLSQWLITVSEALVRARVQPRQANTQKIVDVINKYHRKYFQQHNYTRLEKTVEQAIKECEQIIRSPYTNQFAVFLLKESSLLKKSMEYMNLATYTKYTTCQAFMKEKQDDQSCKADSKLSNKENQKHPSSLTKKEDTRTHSKVSHAKSAYQTEL